MNEPVLNTLRPLEEIEHESDEDNDDEIVNFDEAAEPPTTDNTPSPNAGRRSKTNYLTEKPSITKTVSMESSSYMDPNEIRLAGKAFKSFQMMY